MTRVAVDHCMPRPSAMKTRVRETLTEFERCQTLRNRAIHQSFMPEFRGRRVEYIGRPLWHQTLRYKAGSLKTGQEQTTASLKEVSFQLTSLAIEMKFLVIDLDTFLAKRRRRRVPKE